jgi:hypothetical protein
MDTVKTKELIDLIKKTKMMLRNHNEAKNNEFIDNNTSIYSVLHSSLPHQLPSSSSSTSSLSSSLSSSHFPPSSSSSSLHIVTYATHGGRDDRFCRAVESSIVNKVNLKILGWGKKWMGLSQKLRAAQSYAESVSFYDIILFVDAFDIMFTKAANEENIIKTFKQINKTILFSAECGCWPHVVEDPKICLTQYPTTPTPYRYLNSGAWIGYAGLANIMLKDIEAKAGDNYAMANDQKLVADLYINHQYDVSIDYNAEIFQSMHMTLDPPLPYCDPKTHLKLNSNKIWENRITHTTPSVIHFNGGGKTHHIDMERQSWHKILLYTNNEMLENLKHHKITMPDHESGGLSFEKICQSYIQSLPIHQ